MKSNFEKIGEFNKAFGVKENKTPQKNIFDNNPDLVKQRLALITEEYNELLEAIKNKDYLETVDALTDLEYVILGMSRAIGNNQAKSFDIVHNSNMSKLCISEEEAQKTVEWYKEQYKENKLPYDTPNYRKSDDNIHWVVYNESTNKILKSINYTPATNELKDLCNNSNIISKTKKTSDFEDNDSWF